MYFEILKAFSFHALLVCVSALVLFAPPAAHAQQAGKRVALIIGNSDYRHATDLRNPTNDADRMSKLLKDDLGFDVTLKKDLTVAGTHKALKEFAKRSRDADVALVFYSGHGVAFNDANYMAPTDVPLRLRVKNDASDRVIPLTTVVKRVSKARVGLVFWDACRTHAINVSEAPGARATTATRDLIPTPFSSAPISIAPNSIGTFVAFATSPQATADDGEGDTSPFTGALLKHLASEGRSIDDVMTAVVGEVWKKTKGRQRPQKLTSLSQVFSLMPQAAKRSTEPPKTKTRKASVKKRSKPKRASRSKPRRSSGGSGGGGFSAGGVGAGGFF